MGVVWHSLELEGFGLYRDRVVVRFQSGLNTIVGDNETGKSTLVAGLSAVLFGLPNSSSPDAFGSARFRNWDGPADFLGRAEFSVDGRRYRITRQFDRNRITLEEAASGNGAVSWQPLVQGEHNPWATKRNVPYERKLAELLGVQSRELFEQTFCVGQPLPEGAAVDRQVQELLAGAGGGLESALDGLLGRLRKVTRHNLSVYGAGKQDARLDGRLDVSRRKVQEAEQTLRSQGETLDRLHVEQAELAAAEERWRELKDSLQTKQGTLAAWTDWQSRRNAYEQAARTKTALAQAQEKARSRRAEIEELERKIQQDYAGFDGLPADAGDRLAALVALEQRAQTRAGEIGTLVAQLQADEALLRALEGKLAGEVAPVRGRPDLPAQIESLRRLAAQLKDLRQALATARTAEAGAAAALAGMRPWDKLGGSPTQAVRTLKDRAAEIMPAWARLSGLAARVADIKGRLQDDYRLFMEASPQTLETLHSYQAILGRLQQEAAAGAAELAQLESAAARHREEEMAVAGEFADLEGLGSGFVPAAQAKLAFLEEKIKLETAASQEELAARQARRAQGGRGAVPVAAAVVAALAVWFGAGGSLGWQVAAGAAAAAGVLVWLVTRLATRRSSKDSPDQAKSPSRVRLDEIQKQTDALAPALGKFADSGSAALADAVARLSRKEALLGSLQTQMASAPGLKDMPAARARAAQAQASLQEFLQVMTPFRETYPDPALAQRSWESLKHELQRVQTQAEEVAVSLGVAAEAPESTTLAGKASLESLAALAGVSGAKVATFGELADWLQSLPPRWWEEAAAEAQGFEQASLQLRDAQSRLHDLTAAGTDGLPAEERLAGETAALEKQVAPYSAETDPAAVQTLVKEAQTIEEQLVRRGAAAAENRQHLAKLRGEETREAEEAKALGAGLAAAFEAAGGKASRAAELWQVYSGLARRREASSRELAGLLQGQGVPDEEALARRLTDAEARMLLALRDWEALVASKPGLPPTAGGYDFEELAQRQMVLEKEVDSLTAEAKAADERVDRLRQEVYALKAKDLENLAQLQERLERERRSVEEAEVEAKALGLAYTELDAARRDYQKAYRGFLAERATAHFAELSGAGDRRVLLDDDFRVSLLVASAAGSSSCSVAQLSQGAKDQLYLALRLAVADLLARDVQLPFVFDDPFLACDQARMGRIRATLGQLAKDRQVILLSHRPELMNWGRPVKRDRGAAGERAAERSGDSA